MFSPWIIDLLKLVTKSALSVLTPLHATVTTPHVPMWQPQSQPDWPTKAENALTNVSGYRVNGSQVTSPDLSPTVTSSAIDTYSALPSCYIPISPTLSSCHLEM